MTNPNNPTRSRWLDYLTLRFCDYCSITARKLLLLRLFFSRSMLFRAVLSSLILAHLKLEWAGGANPLPIFQAHSPFLSLTVSADNRPELVDIDGDGDLDAFIGVKDGNTLYFANTGSAGNPDFAAPQTNPFGLTDVGGSSSPALADIDHDGDLDAFITNGSGDISYFANTGNATKPIFAAPQINPFGLQNIDGFICNPTLADIDGDGDLDAFIGQKTGNLTYFANTGSPTQPAFAAPQTNPFGLSKVRVNNSPEFADINGDGDLDAFIGDGYSDISYFANTGSRTQPTFAPFQLNPFGMTAIDHNSNPNLVDLDGDKDLDLLIGSGFGDIVYFPNEGTTKSPAFTLSPLNPFGLTEVSDDSKPELVDIDGDGDLDAFVGSGYGDIFYFANTGGASSPAFASPQANPFGLVEVDGLSSPALGDIDDDGDLDAFVGDANGDISYFANTGSASSPAFASPQVNAFGLNNTIGNLINLELADIDDDGDLDIFIGAGNGDIGYFANTGSANSPAFAAPQINPFGLIKVENSSAIPEFVDLDGDGDLDTFIGTGEGHVLYFTNTGSASSPAFAAPQTNPFGLADVGSGNSLEVVDIDADGDLDALAGNGQGFIHFFRNRVIENHYYLPSIRK